jgi:hypothetical protein
VQAVQPNGQPQSQPERFAGWEINNGFAYESTSTKVEAKYETRSRL